MDFYSAAAQVIPVLLLAISFESRTLMRQPATYNPDDPDNASSWNVTQIVVRVYATVLIGAGEIAALTILYQKEETHLTKSLVWLGLGTALVALCGSIISHQLEFWRAWWSTDAKRDWWFAAFALALLVVLTFKLADFIP